MTELTAVETKEMKAVKDLLMMTNVMEMLETRMASSKLPTPDQVRRAYIDEVLRLHKGNQRQAAKAMGIHPAHLCRTLKSSRPGDNDHLRE